MSSFDLLNFLSGQDVKNCLVAAYSAEQELPKLRDELAQAVAVNGELNRMVETLKERLARAMEREQKSADGFGAREAELRANLTAAETNLATERKERDDDHRALTEELGALRAKLAGMIEHPDVKRAEQVRLKEQARALLARAAELEPAPVAEENPPPEGEEKKS